MAEEAPVHKGQVPFYLMTELALTSVPFPGMDSLSYEQRAGVLSSQWNVGILRVRTHPGVHHGSAAAEACPSQARPSLPRAAGAGGFPVRPLPGPSEKVQEQSRACQHSACSQALRRRQAAVIPALRGVWRLTPEGPD